MWTDDADLNWELVMQVDHLCAILTLNHWFIQSLLVWLWAVSLVPYCLFFSTISVQSNLHAIQNVQESEQI